MDYIYQFAQGELIEEGKYEAFMERKQADRQIAQSKRGGRDA